MGLCQVNPVSKPQGSFMRRGQSTKLVEVSNAMHRQQRETCYAHAVATAIRATEKRIIGRVPQAHQSIVQSIIERYGCQGAVTYQVAQEQCRKRNLRCQYIDLQLAIEAIQSNRVVIAIFHLSDAGWKKLQNFFQDQRNRKKVFQFEPNESSCYGEQGHAAVIIGQNTDYWKVKNSWGKQFADDGYFRMAKTVEMLFIDVYFIESDLTSEDQANFISYTYTCQLQEFQNKQQQKINAETVASIIKNILKSLKMNSSLQIDRLNFNHRPYGSALYQIRKNIIEQCRNHNLRCHNIYVSEAMELVLDNKMIIAIIQLSKEGWNHLERFMNDPESNHKIMTFQENHFGCRGFVMATVGQIGHYWMIKNPFASYLSVFSKTNHFRIEKSTTMHLFYISHDLQRQSSENTIQQRKPRNMD